MNKVSMSSLVSRLETVVVELNQTIILTQKSSNENSSEIKIKSVFFFGFFSNQLKTLRLEE